MGCCLHAAALRGYQMGVPTLCLCLSPASTNLSQPVLNRTCTPDACVLPACVPLLHSCPRLQAPTCLAGVSCQAGAKSSLLGSAGNRIISPTGHSRSDGIAGGIGDAGLAELLSLPCATLRMRSQPELAAHVILKGLSGLAAQQDSHAGCQPGVGADSLLQSQLSGPADGPAVFDGHGHSQDTLLSIQSTSALLHAGHELPERPNSLSLRQLLVHATTAPSASSSHSAGRRSLFGSTQRDHPGAMHSSSSGEYPQARSVDATERWSTATSTARTAIAAMFSRASGTGLRTRMSSDLRGGGAGSAGRSGLHTALRAPLQHAGVPLPPSLPAPSLAIGSALAESHDRCHRTQRGCGRARTLALCLTCTVQPMQRCSNCCAWVAAPIAMQPCCK